MSSRSPSLAAVNELIRTASSASSLLCSPKVYKADDEPEEADSSPAWVYVNANWPLPADKTKWMGQIRYIGQFSSMSPEERWQKHQNSKRAAEFENCKMIVVMKFEEENAETLSLQWEFLLFALKKRMNLIADNKPGNGNRWKKTKRAEEMAENASLKLREEVVKCLGRALRNPPALEEKPLKCDVCDEGFATKYALKQHQTTHTGNQHKYFCEQCGAGFYFKKGLKQHMPIHNENYKTKPSTKREPRECPHCAVGCQNSTYFIKHVMSKHPEEYLNKDGVPDEAVARKKFGIIQKRKPGPSAEEVQEMEAFELEHFGRTLENEPLANDEPMPGTSKRMRLS